MCVTLTVLAFAIPARTALAQASSPAPAKPEPSLIEILSTWASENTGNQDAIPQLVGYIKGILRGRGPNPQTREARKLRQLASGSPDVYIPIIRLHSLAHLLAIQRRDARVAEHLRFETMRLIEEYMSKTRSPEGWNIGARVYMTLAATLRDGVDLRMALALLEKGLDTDPFNPSVLHAAASIREKLGHYSSASELFRRLLKVWPAPEAELRLALCQARMGKSKVAARLLEKLANSTGPEWVRALAYQEWSKLLLKMGDLHRALAVAREGREAQPEDESLSILLAFMAGPRDEESRALILRLTAAPTGTGPTPRGRYNMWPEGAEENEIFLARAVSARMPLLIEALRARLEPEPESGHQPL
jgi:tetratricopeptide (TPR) repeat protein